MSEHTEYSSISGARNPEEVIAALRTACGKHGEVKRIRLSCAHASGQLSAQIHFDGDAVNAADAIGGQVSGDRQLRATLLLSADFRCGFAVKDGNCLCMF